MDLGSVSSDAGAEVVCFGQERTEPEGKAFSLRVNLCPSSTYGHELG